MQVTVPVDEDTRRVIVGIYEVGSTLYLGGTANDVEPSSTASLDLYAGVRDGKTGTFYLSVELCSTTVCTSPMLRTTYQRAERTSSLSDGETYLETREEVGGSTLPVDCLSDLQIQPFSIN